MTKFFLDVLSVWIAHKVAGDRNYYYFVAIKFVLARVISKEKLTRRGWVSLYDYYANA